MSYPKCKDNRTDCRFAHNGGFSTAMWSPIQYDRSGKAVAGGANQRSCEISCSVCGRRWAETRTELEAAQGVNPTWAELA